MGGPDSRLPTEARKQRAREPDVHFKVGINVDRPVDEEVRGQP